MNIQEVADRLTALEQDNGRLDPADVVEAARDPGSPMHQFFEWDDGEAARLHRLGQARQLIRRVKIEVVVRDVPMDVVRYVRDPETVSYRNITSVRSEEDTARRVVTDEMSRVAKAAKRARAIAAVLGIDGEIQEIIRIAGVVQRMATATDQPAGTA